MRRLAFIAGALLLSGSSASRAQTAPDLWLTYPRVSDAALRDEYRASVASLVVADESPTLRAARDEIVAGIHGLTGADVAASDQLRARGRALAGHRNRE